MYCLAAMLTVRLVVCDDFWLENGEGDIRLPFHRLICYSVMEAYCEAGGIINILVLKDLCYCSGFCNVTGALSWKSRNTKVTRRKKKLFYYLSCRFYRLVCKDNFGLLLWVGEISFEAFFFYCSRVFWGIVFFVPYPLLCPISKHKVWRWHYFHSHDDTLRHLSGKTPEGSSELQKKCRCLTVGDLNCQVLECLVCSCTV